MDQTRIQLRLIHPLFALLSDLKINVGDVVNVVDKKIHPSYNPWTDEYDFGLAILSRDTTENSPLLKLNSDDSFPSLPAKALTMGWGDMDPDDKGEEFPDKLQAVVLDVISNAQCACLYYSSWIFQDMICALTEDKDSCRGDSGGPFIFEGSSVDGDIATGIVSWGVGCAQIDSPGVSVH